MHGAPMPHDLHITSTANPKIKELLALRDKRDRDKTGLFLIEGYRELSRALSAGVGCRAIYVCPKFFLGTNEGALLDEARKKGTHIITCDEKVFQKISYRDRPDGLLGLGHAMRKTLLDLEDAIRGVENPLLVVAESIEKPGNLGTILRSADGAGAHGVIVSDRCTDIYNPNVVRASVGTLFSQPVIETSTEEAIAFLKKHHISIIASTPAASTLYYEADLAKPVAIILGTEQLGLKDIWLETADIKVRIPMKGLADSLNVAMASTILLYEAARQRA